MVARLRRPFFERYTPVVARELLGSKLVRIVDGARLAGEIVEAEAYRGLRDPASHAYTGQTRRNSVMFGEAGHAYLYFSYGFHWCLNLTTEPRGRAGAVLIRAIEPVEGLERMMMNRQVESDAHVADGPGKLTRALGIDGSLNGEDVVTSGRLFVEEGEEVRGIGVGPRVGITKGTGYLWRFFVKGSMFVSGGRAAAGRRIHNYGKKGRRIRGVVG